MKLKKDGTVSRQGEGGGKPPKFKDETALATAILLYFSVTEKRKEMPSKAGLCFALQIDKSTYSDYKKRYPEPIKNAELYIEKAWVQRLSGGTPVGAIFYLKNAFKEEYRDRYDTDITTGGKMLPTPIYGGKSTHIQGYDGHKKDIPTDKKN